MSTWRTSEAKAQLLLHEQTQRSEMLISELRQALKAITDQDIANTRATAEMEVLLRKELLETKHRLAELEPAWDMFIAKHNEEEEAQDSEQRRRAAVVAQPAERRNRRLENEANRIESRMVTSMPPSDAAATTSRLATPRGADTDLSGAHAFGSASTLGMFSPAVSSGAESAGVYGHGRLRRGACYRAQSRQSEQALARSTSGGHRVFFDASLASRRTYPGLYAQDHSR